MKHPVTGLCIPFPMKKRLWNLVLPVLLAVPAMADLKEGLVAYFDFESEFENRAAAAGSTWKGPFKNGRVEGSFEGAYSATPGSAGGAAGKGLTLTTAGGKTQARVNLPISFGPGNDLGTFFTISAWYNLNDPPIPNDARRYFVFEGESSYDVSFSLRKVVGDDEVFDAQTFAAGKANNATPLNVGGAGMPGWHHVVLTYADAGGGETRITTYIDGTNVGTLQRATDALFDKGINLGAARSEDRLMAKKGKVYDAGGRAFDGKIDEVAMWNRVLSESEITSLYRSGSPKPLGDYR